MSRQSTAPVQFQQTTRRDDSVLMTSGRAGVVIPVAFIPLLIGDSCSGAVAVDLQLAEMPRPLANGVVANFQAWFVPKVAHPQFTGRDEFNHSYTGAVIKSLGAVDRTPPVFFYALAGATLTTALASEFFTTLGLHVPTGSSVNSDIVDAFMLIYNFRLASHSSRLTRKKYASEDIAEATKLPPAFWPSSRFASTVPDYERALVVGTLDLDVLSGSVTLTGSAPVTGMTRAGTTSGTVSGTLNQTASSTQVGASTGATLTIGTLAANLAGIVSSLAGSTIGTTLADIDKARTTQAFAKLRTAYAGNDASGFDNDDTLVAMLMQGFTVGADEFARPWLLASSRVPVGFAERFATDGISLDKSVTLGSVSSSMRLNVPRQDTGGIIVVTVELLPERLDERMSDEFMLSTTVSALPNALRDVQRIEPVDMVLNRRVDAKHTTPGGLYGYEPMNMKWNRNFTRLGGKFYQATPGTAYTQQRAAIWQTNIVNPAFASTHFLAPVPFPHDVFSDTLAPAFEITARHAVSIVGLTQMGDVLAENGDDYLVTSTAGV